MTVTPRNPAEGRDDGASGAFVLGLILGQPFGWLLFGAGLLACGLRFAYEVDEEDRAKASDPGAASNTASKP